MGKYFHYYNANPKNKETTDCTYRALSLFLDKSWEEIATLDAQFYLEHGMWLYTTEIQGEYARVARTRIDLFLQNYKQVYKFGVDKHIPTLRSFIDEYAEEDKIYLCDLNGHMVTIKNKKVWDTWDSSAGCPYIIFAK